MCCVHSFSHTKGFLRASVNWRVPEEARRRGGGEEVRDGGAAVGSMMPFASKFN